MLNKPNFSLIFNKFAQSSNTEFGNIYTRNLFYFTFSLLNNPAIYIADQSS
jgi:hypothetical protein